nr:MAG TPA: hypothetical protein [Caudoviricetes sp.]
MGWGLKGRQRAVYGRVRDRRGCGGGCEREGVIMNVILNNGEK